jgi:hypothetical protein
MCCKQMKHQRSTEVDRTDRADRAGGECKALEAVKVVRTR